MSAFGQAALAAVSPHASAGIERFAGLAYTVASIAALFAVAHWIECRNARPTTTSSVAQAAGSRDWRGFLPSYSR